MPANPPCADPPARPFGQPPGRPPIAVKLALVGDVHGLWTESDVDYFNQSDYDALLFVGDLGTLRPGGDLPVARRVAPLTKPTLLIPGNHDAVAISELVAETLGVSLRSRRRARRHARRVERLRRALGPVQLVGFSHHTLYSGADSIGVIAARPHSMGGQLNFAGYLNRAFDVADLEASAAKLCAVIDACPHDRLLVLAHNGPSGLGAAATDMFGADFKRPAVDWGDRDLRHALAHARHVGKQVLAVVAGHMHLRTKQGAERVSQRVVDGVLYVNAARVPRIARDGESRVHHHVALTIDGSSCRAEPIPVRVPD